MNEPGANVDTGKLASHLATRLDASVDDADVLHDGLNLSIGISTRDEVYAYVVRRPNKLRESNLFNSLATEFEVLERLADTPVPAPAPVLFCEDESILDGPFFATTYLDGEEIPVGSRLPERFRDERSREQVANRLVDALAGVHTTDVSPFVDVCERVGPREQVERAIERLDRARRVTGRDLSTLRAVGEWLRDNSPPEWETALVHGDFKPGNVLFGAADTPEITGVLDWEAAYLGDPLTELGYFLLYWRESDDPTPSLEELEATYSDETLREARDLNANGLCPFTTEPGSPSRRELVRRYEEQTGLSFERQRYYRAHAAFMLATVWEDLHRHQVAGGATSDYAPIVDYMTVVAAAIVDGVIEL